MPNIVVPFGIGGEYQIKNALRLRASNGSFLSRMMASQNSTRFVVSFGFKPGSTLSANQAFACGYGNSGNYTYFGTLSGNEFEFLNVSGGVTNVFVKTNAVFRDPSSHYLVQYVVDTNLATAADRYQIFVNGFRQSVTVVTDTLAQGGGLHWGDACTHYIGAFNLLANFLDGLLSEFVFTGQLTTSAAPTDFGSFSPATGAWAPKRYAGAFGANGCRLEFKDATSTMTIGYDTSGNANHWSSSGIEVAAGVAFDQSTDTPTSNWCTLSPLAPSTSGLDFVGLRVVNSGAASARGLGTFAMPFAGKWYFELSQSRFASGGAANVGLMQGSDNGGSDLVVYSSNGDKNISGVTSNYGVTWSSTSGTTDVIGVAVDQDAGTIAFHKNNEPQGVIPHGLAGPLFPFCIATGTGNKFIDLNFGQRPFAYTPPSGFAALCVKNLPLPSIKRGDDACDIVARTGTGAPANVTHLRFAPDLIWIKRRNAASDHRIYDTARGAGQQLYSNLMNQESASSAGLTAFTGDGYSFGIPGDDAAENASAGTYIDWVWRRGAVYGFDIVVYTGTGAARTVAHGLGAVPHFMIVKPRGGTIANGWRVYHRSLGAAAYLQLNTTAAQAAYSDWNNTAPTSSVFSVDGSPAGTTNESGTNYVAYLWTEIPGFSRFGAYAGTGTVDGMFVWCGFRPRVLLIKSNTSTASWMIYDAARNAFNVVDSRLAPNTSNAEASSGAIDITASGFKLRANDANTNGGATGYIFAAFAETPFKYANAR